MKVLVNPHVVRYQDKEIPFEAGTVIHRHYDMGNGIDMTICTFNTPYGEIQSGVYNTDLKEK